MNNFNALEETEKIIEFIRKYYKDNNLKGAVIGISGGKDSGVVAGLFCEALGSENVTGIWMPCHSKNEDYKNALLVAKHFGFELKEFDLTDTFDNYVTQIKSLNEVSEDDLIDANINIKPRLRMTTLYYYAAMLSKIKGGTYIVPGTSNKCEIYVGYFTKGGDNVSDIQVLANLSVSEVIAIGEFIGVPECVVKKTPDDGLSGKTDEEKLGVTYKEIENFLSDADVPLESLVRIKTMHQKSRHKFITPTYKES